MGVVVVGVDLSETSASALRAAIRQARWREASVVVLHVLQTPAYAAIEFSGAVMDLEIIKEAGEKALHEFLAEIEAGEDDGFPVSVRSEVQFGHAGHQLHEAARRHDAELAVLGSRGLGGVKGLLLGSVSTYAVHHITCPLLVVPGADHDAVSS